MGTGSPGSVWVVHLQSAESDPGPIARTTPGTDYICGRRILQGQNRLRHGYEGSVLRAHTGWTRDRLNQGSVVGWSGGNGGQGKGPHVRAAAGTGGGDGSGLLGAAAQGVRAMDGSG